MIQSVKPDEKHEINLDLCDQLQTLYGNSFNETKTLVYAMAWHAIPIATHISEHFGTDLGIYHHVKNGSDGIYIGGYNNVVINHIEKIENIVLVEDIVVDGSQIKTMESTLKFLKITKKLDFNIIKVSAFYYSKSNYKIDTFAQITDQTVSPYSVK